MQLWPWKNNAPFQKPAAPVNLPERSDGTQEAKVSALVRLDSVTKHFRMGQVVVEALRDVSLEIHVGEFLVVLGPSGSGKSTLLNIIGGLDRPTRGEVWYRNKALSTFTPTQLTQYRRRTVGFIFQFYNLIPNLTARENVMVCTELVDDPLDVDEVLRLVQLEDRADHFPSQLSGGEQQRVAIARALAKNPELLLCDEPTGALDYVTGKRILRLLVDLKSKLGKTVVLITHNSAIAPIADRIARLRSGQLVELRKNDTPIAPEEVVW